jgi:hypothetical protein
MQNNLEIMWTRLVIYCKARISAVVSFTAYSNSIFSRGFGAPFTYQRFVIFACWGVNGHFAFGSYDEIWGKIELVNTNFELAPYFDVINPPSIRST